MIVPGIKKSKKKKRKKGKAEQGSTVSGTRERERGRDGVASVTSKGKQEAGKGKRAPPLPTDDTTTS